MFKKKKRLVRWAHQNFTSLEKCSLVLQMLILTDRMDRIGCKQFESINILGWWWQCQGIPIFLAHFRPLNTK